MIRAVMSSTRLRLRVAATLGLLAFFVPTVPGWATSPSAGPSSVLITGLVAPNRTILATMDFTHRTRGEGAHVALALPEGLRLTAAFREVSTGLHESLELEADPEPGTARLKLHKAEPAGTEIKLRLRFHYRGHWIKLGKDCWALEPHHSLPELARRLTGQEATLSAKLEPPAGFAVLGAERNLVLVAERFARSSFSVAGQWVQMAAPRAASAGMTSSEVFTGSGAPIHIISVVGGTGGEEARVVSGSGGGSRPMSVSRAPDWAGPVMSRRPTRSFLPPVVQGLKAQGRAFGPPGPNGLVLVSVASSGLETSWPWLLVVPEKNGAAAPGSLHRTRLEEFDFNFARRWWGHSVLPSSEVDRWLLDGLAELGVVIAAESRGGWRKEADSWLQRRRDLTLATSNGKSALDLGPLDRAGDGAGPHLLARLRAFKGAFVLQALRGWMRQSSTIKPDGRFFAGLHEFSATFAGQEASLEGFQRIMEKHFPTDQYPGSQRNLDWFFAQWVRGSAVPTLSAKLNVQSAGVGKARIQGTVTVAGVPADFRLRLPVQFDLGAPTLATATNLMLEGPGTHAIDIEIEAPEKLNKPLLDAKAETLTR